MFIRTWKSAGLQRSRVRVKNTLSKSTDKHGDKHDDKHEDKHDDKHEDKHGCGKVVPNKYKERKYSPGLPKNDSCCCVFEPVPDVSSGVFRDTSGESLGPCAGSINIYKVPEYFSFHNMSFYDLNMSMVKYRSDRIDSKRK